MQAPDITLDRSTMTHGTGLNSSNAHSAMQDGSSHRGTSVRRRRRAMSFDRLRLPAFASAGLRKITGYSLIAGSLLSSIALATWTISDPSLTFANGSKAENWLGFWGASFADVSMQFLGFASIILLAVPAIWGLLKTSDRPMERLRSRFGFLVISLVFLCAAIATIAIPLGWPLEVGLGGVVGDAVLSIPRAFLGAFPSGFLAVILGVIFAIPGLWCLARACNLQRGLPPRTGSIDIEQDRKALANELARERAGTPHMDIAPSEEGRDWMALIATPIGMVLHTAYSLNAWWRNRRSNQTFNDGIEHDYESHEAKPAQRNSAVADAGLNVARTEPSFEARSTSYDEDQLISDGHVPHIHATDDAAPWHDESPAGGLIERPKVLERRSVAAPYSITPDDNSPIPHTDADNAEPEQTVRAAPKIARGKPKPPAAKFELPPLDLLSEQTSLVDDPSLSNEALEENARALEGVLEDFGVKGQILKVRPGPVVTLYELEPAPGVKSSRVIGLAEDIARSMSAIAARVAVVPGRNAIGIELPNKRRETVYLREQLSSKEFRNTKAKLAMCLGKNIGGEPVIADLSKMPHLLMAGTTGSGKSVGINTMILSLLYRMGPDQCKMIMIDPKMLELSIYDGIPHLLTPVVVDPKKAVVALKWTVREMEDRYKKMSKVGVRNIDGFNTRVAEAAAKGEVITRTVQTGFDRNTGEAIYETEELELEAMPFIVVVIDEMADLMMVAGKDIEGTVQRLAQMARAAGIHVIMATQRPSVDVITGTIKANFPTRISFQVTSKIDSRTILGEMGAEQLLGMGDMLYMAGGGRITRVHGPFVADQEVEDIVNHLKSQGVPQYLEAVTEEDDEDAGDPGSSSGSGSDVDGDADPYDQAVAVVLRDRKVSTSYIQRRLSIGYNRAASLIERMEQEGLISSANHAGKREILVPAEDETM